MDFIEIFRADRIIRFVNAQQDELRRQHRELRRIERLERAFSRARSRLPETSTPSWSYRRSPGAR